MIPVTKPYLPNREKLNQYIDGIYERGWLTNNGPLLQELTARLEKHLGVENLLLVSNGTLALQIAYRVLGITPDNRINDVPEAITTPFTFVATASSLKWEGITPVFADIDPDTWCLKPENIKPAITSQTKAIVPVHVFGNACDVDAIDEIAKEYDLKVIYDAAHAFGVEYKGKSLLSYGDAATLSFHATKLFHTVEGGAIVFKHREDLEKAKKLISFGMSGPETIDEVGINAKMNEIQAAMGLCVLDEISEVHDSRRTIWNSYKEALTGQVVFQSWEESARNNFSYFPILLKSEEQVLKVQSALAKKNIHARRYFYPSLNNVKAFDAQEEMPISESVASKILCLPLYPTLNNEQVRSVVLSELKRPNVINLIDFNDALIIKFIRMMDSFFKPAIEEQTDLHQYLKKIKSHGCIIGTLNSSGEITSIATFYANDSTSGDAFISYLAVNPENQGNGIAKILIHEVKNCSRLRGMRALNVTTWQENEQAIALYKSNGFELIKTVESDIRVTVYLRSNL